MKPRTISLLIALVVVLVGFFTVVIPRIRGGSDGSTSAYCKTVSADQTQIGDLVNSGDAQTALINSLGLFQGMAANAPADIAGSWTALNTAIASLASAIRATGRPATDFAAGRFPSGLTSAQKQAVRDAADTLGSSTTTTAAAEIEQEVRDVCQVDLDM